MVVEGGLEKNEPKTSKNQLINNLTLLSERRVHQHRRRPAAQRRHDQDRQDLQSPVHVRHHRQERHLRNDAHQRSGHDQHHLSSRGSGTQVR